AWRPSPKDCSDRLRLTAGKERPGAAAGPASGEASVRSESGEHALQSEQMGERLELAPLVVAKAHHQRKARRLESLDVDLAHVDRCQADALRRRLVGRVFIFLVLHLAQLRF